ncbi:MAG: hypothetical protein RL744_467, partial [Pseudomonadota bacterium]
VTLKQLGQKIAVLTLFTLPTNARPYTLF